MKDMKQIKSFSIDVLEERKVNKMFSIGRARVFYLGPNPNRVIIGKEAGEVLASSIPGTPIIGKYNLTDKDFEGHDTDQVAYGFIPLDPKMEWITFMEGEEERTYLATDVVIWDGRFEEAEGILKQEKSLSMELNPDTITGEVISTAQGTYYDVKHAEFSGITVLGEDVDPCFKDARFLQVYSKMIAEYANFLGKQEEQGGSLMNYKDIISAFNLTADETVLNVMDLYTEQLESKEVLILPVFNNEDSVIIHNFKDNGSVKINFEANEDGVEITKTEEVEFFAETLEEKQEETLEEEKQDEIEDSEEPKEQEEEEQLEKPEEETQDGEEVKEESDEKTEEITEEEKSEDMQDLQNNTEDYKKLYESATKELEQAQEKLNEYAKHEKIALLDKISFKLKNKAIIEEIKKDLNKFSVDEIKSKIGVAYTQELLEQDNEQEEEILDFNLRSRSVMKKDGPWDLVEKYKK